MINLHQLKMTKYCYFNNYETSSSRHSINLTEKKKDLPKWLKWKRKTWIQQSVLKDNFSRNREKKLSYCALKRHTKLNDCMKSLMTKRKLSKPKKIPFTISSTNLNRNLKMWNYKTRKNFNYSKSRWRICMKEISRLWKVIMKMK